MAVMEKTYLPFSRNPPQSSQSQLSHHRVRESDLEMAVYRVWFINLDRLFKIKQISAIEYKNDSFRREKIILGEI